jgi:hypothetical protein
MALLFLKALLLVFLTVLHRGLVYLLVYLLVRKLLMLLLNVMGLLKAFHFVLYPALLLLLAF